MAYSFTASSSNRISGKVLPIDTGGWSLGCWYYPTSLTPDFAQLIHITNGSAAGGQQLCLDPGGGTPQGVRVSQVFTGNEVGVRTANNVLTSNAWNCIIGAHSGDTAALGGDFVFLGTRSAAMADASAANVGATGTRQGGRGDATIGNFPASSLAPGGRIAQAFAVAFQMTLGEAERFRQGDWTVLYKNGPPRFFLPLQGAGLADLAGIA